MRARVLGGLGALATLLAAAVVVAPGVADPLSVLDSLDPERLLLVLGAVVGAYAAWAARGGTPDREPTEGPAARFAAAGDRPERASAADRARTGETFDASVADACDGDESALSAVRSNLADAAASAHARAADRGPEQAELAVETGAWTDDRAAAAFLSGESGPNFSLAARLRAWLDPAAERRRRVERTVREVEAVLGDRGADGGGVGVADAPGSGTPADDRADDSGGGA
ncbi:hypothetical protein M0R89_14080 [Halorussus limi]|uniref:Uncharacterized protein n=1 Tax=Halorussus limi TaxID=2938695 RepID=A0A8U0HRF5_9EURY|nr:hypothetical protein [Halorussus limi]UPV73662.1 hypothetical protein M0R89_14080 [Halorussus limi]